MQFIKEKKKMSTLSLTLEADVVGGVHDDRSGEHEVPKRFHAVGCVCGG
jgi:hypothetical protein